MNIPQSLIDEAIRMGEIITTPSYQRAITDASKVFELNSKYIDQYFEFQKSIPMLNNAITIFNNSALKYLLSDVSDLQIKNNPQTLIESKKENFSISINQAASVVSIKKILPNIEYKDASDFNDFLGEYPMLGYKSPVGVDIYNMINNCKKHSLVNINMFRIRKSEFGKSLSYLKREMIGPPYGISKQNRFNNIGIGVAYYSEKLLTEEVDLKENESYTTIEVELIREFKMLDIRAFEIPIFFLCHDKADDKTKEYNKQYLLPNYLTDCAKMNNFEGIIYKSVIDNAVSNYAFFDLSMKDVRVIQKNDFNWKENSEET